ncbi:MAG: SCP2 sterol-binding domain-containing protein [Alphaproteobacteria bacterium]
MTTLDEATQAIRTRLADFAGLNARIAFDFGDGGRLLVDATTAPPSLDEDSAEADCTVRLSLDDFGRMVTGGLSPSFAYMTGKLKVAGSMGLAMKVAALLED